MRQQKRTSAAKAAPAAGKEGIECSAVGGSGTKAKPDSAGNKVNTVQKPAAPKATTKPAKVSNAVATETCTEGEESEYDCHKAADAKVKSSSVASKTSAKKNK